MPENSISRRSLTKSAAWSVPVVAVAVAAPMAAASVNTASLAWTASTTSLLTLNIIDTQTTVTAGALVTVPTQFTLTNGAGAIAGETGVVTIVVSRPAGINITVGTARGFGVRQYNGALTPTGSRSVVYQRALGQNVGIPTTSYTSQQTFTVASNGTLNIPVQFGLAGTNSGLGVNALASFPVSLSIAFPDRTLSASTTISVPVGAGVL
ncbi:hypothetical protein NB037_09575 [Rathayibacter sp. ZW T2_19]|uniref:Uncharacterized protein n=1 Tax=Rathayibacter rubneri TaxID=2950106 RepID=A0A9X2DZL6_9MICO|nr:hypothetical protein [Rathayibacter rubneri]MCM6762663.1 hypothetical protein [Rathayibacter rubneri]